MDKLDPLEPLQAPTAKSPLLGMTILVVEDSRFASEAMRLMCLRSGARIRRADCLRAARQHLQVYRPSALIVDLGLPDGSGLELIRELTRATPRIGVILAISGNEEAHDMAIEAGADAFLIKPVPSLGNFQQAILAHLPREKQPNQPCAISMEPVQPDPVAYRDDMTHIASILEDHAEGPMLDYVAQFVGSVAKTANDTALAEAADELGALLGEGAVSHAKIAQLAGLVQDRIGERIAI